ncbi:10560_t:CDS:2 [Paraglomus brasilianum]|uniref:10560_t:CDS:1 n=1 Tax=Paraglomus brasilianum TaxID=144538 RepID=A0A9N9FMX2_9GLOM|nr:10560_t:CDS:2 [Paraglomus brasilianum]
MSSSPSQYAMPTPQPYTNDSSITPTYPNASYAPTQQPSRPFSSTTPVDSQTVEKSENSGDIRSRTTRGKTRGENNFATNMCLYGTSLNVIRSSRYEETVIILIIMNGDEDTGTKENHESQCLCILHEELTLIIPEKTRGTL